MLIRGDALEELKKLKEGSVDCIVTSPPYWQLRQYEAEKQLGLEPTFHEYLENLWVVFDEIKSVLKKTGTVFVNLGDTYAGTMPKDKNTAGYNSKVPKITNMEWHGTKNQSVQDKSLCQIPSRFAIEMTNRGWTLRNEIIWKKSNSMPSSAKDRFTVDYEKIFFFVKNKKYWFEQQFEAYAPASDVRYRQALRANRSYNSKEPYRTNTPYSNGAAKIKGDLPKYKRGVGLVQSRGDDADGLVVGGNDEGRNMRSIWNIPTKPSSIAHFAIYPEELVTRMIKAGCPKDGTVLDPFVGAGTTCVVAKKLGRECIGIDISEKYIKIAEERIKNTPSPLL